MNETVNEIGYFGGMNTADGFRSFFGELTDRVSYSYVIKGGPGTGKSYFMNLVRTEAENRGLSVELICCASDAFSLDGILIPSLNIGIFDGTAPHVLDPKLPAVSGEWIRFDSFLDKTVLEKRRTEIEALSRSKKALYERERAASVLYAEAEKEILAITEECLYREKMSAAAGRILKKNMTGKTGETKNIQVSSVGMRGTVKLPTLEKAAKDIRYVYGHGAELFLSLLLRLTEEARKTVYVSRHPVLGEMPTDLFFPDSGVLFTVSERKPAESGINMERFLDKEHLKSNRSSMRILHKIREQASEAMNQSFRQIADCHFAIERIYGEALDKEAKERYSAELIGRIFGRC